MNPGRLPSDSGSHVAVRCNSAQGHNRTHASQQKRHLFDHLIGAEQNRWRCRKAERAFAVRTCIIARFAALNTLSSFSQSMISLARSKTMGGTERPRVLAVLRLSASSYL